MEYISSAISRGGPQKHIFLDALHVQRPSAVRQWWSDDGATVPPVPRDNRDFAFGPMGYYSVKNVRVVPDAITYTDEYMYLDHSIQIGAYRKVDKFKRICEEWQIRIDKFVELYNNFVEVPGPIMMGISQGGRRVWGHWIVQNLAKCLFFLDNFPSGKIAIPRSYFGKHRNFGDILLKSGFPMERIFILERNQGYIFEDLTVLDYLYASHIIHPRAVALLAEAGDRISRLPEYQNSPEPRRQRVFIPRTMQGSRAIANAPEIEDLARRFGFAVVPLGTRSVIEQVKVWREAEMVMSVCGSDLTNMVFTSGPLRIASLTPTWFKDIFFADLASAKGLEWFELFCSVTPDEGTHSSRSVYVNPAFATRLFEALTGETASG